MPPPGPLWIGNGRSQRAAKAALRSGESTRHRGDVSAEGVDLTQFVRQPNQLAAAKRSPVAAIGHQYQRPVDPTHVSYVEQLSPGVWCSG